MTIEPVEPDAAMRKLAEAGAWHDFFGVDGDLFKLDAVVYEASEDPSDDYRSYLESIVVVPAPDAIFFAMPVARVKVVDAGNVEGWRLVDEGGHCWLEVGTDYSDDEYYPCYVFRYTPKEPQP